MTLRPADRESPYDESGPEQQRVRSLLGDLPDPGPMPDDLVQRIQARLADEALHAGTTGEHGSHGGAVVDLTARRRMRVMGTVAAIGTTAAAAAVVGALVTGGFDRPGSGAAAFESPSTARATSTPVSSPSAPEPAIRISSTDVTGATLDAEASRLLRTTGPTIDPGAAESPTLGPLATPKGLGDCLTSLGIRDYTKVSAALTRYETKPAVVLAVAGRSGELQAWVVDRSCTELTPHRVIS